MILVTRFTFIVERSWKNMYFHPNWFDHLLLMASYPVTIEPDHHWTWLKMCPRDERTATKNIRRWCFILLEKTQKNRMGGGIHRRLCVRGLSYTQHIFLLKAKRKRNSWQGKNQENSFVTSHVTWSFLVCLNQCFWVKKRKSKMIRFCQIKKVCVTRKSAYFAKTVKKVSQGLFLRKI